MISSTGFLKGLRALDLTDLKGQLCGRILGDLGMEVVKVEPPGGDPVRNFGPFVNTANGSRVSAPFAHLNANKESTILDLASADGREGFLRLAEKTDVVLESFAPGYMESMGLGYESLCAVNPRVVVASVSGFGQSGPRKKFACTDIVVLAMSGLLYVAGDPSLPPCKPPETQAYYFGSLYAALGVVAALYRRERTGRGDHVDISMQEALATQEHMIRLYANDGQILERQGSQHGQVAPARIFHCRDGYVYLYVTRQHWKIFLKAWKDHPAEFDDPEWQNNVFRRARVDTINRHVEAFVARHTKEELINLFQERGVPCTPVNTPGDFARDEQVRSRGFVVPVEHPGVGAVDQPAAPFLIDGARPPVRPAPALGGWRASDGDRVANGGTKTSSEHRKLAGAPLDGMRIVSFDHVLAGPYGTTLLAELGADVIKVESSKGGMDPFRFFGTGEDPNRSPRFLEFNRNKRSLTVNLKRPEGPKVILDLVSRSDAVLDNYSVDVMARLGLGYEDLCRARPDIVNIRMPGLGCTGPKRYYATVGVNITAFTGLSYLWNHRGNTDPPVGSQTVFPDYVSGVIAAILIVSAVLGRERTKSGAFIDLSQGEATAFMIGASLIEGQARGGAAEPIGNDSPVAAPHGCYRSRGEDRWCVIAAESDGQWQALAKILGPEIAGDERFKSMENRLQHREELNALLEQWTHSRDANEVMETLQRVGVPCGVVQNGADLVSDPHLKERGFIVAVQNQRLGRVVLPGFPLRFAGSVIEPRWEFPELGRDTRNILREVLGYDEERITALAKGGVLE